MLPDSHPRHEWLMHVALRRAVRALGRTRPNPCVGAVVARDGAILAVGHHARAGTAHAEVVALRQAGAQARGADLYVTLEPCSHHGRTPPCVDAVLAAGIARVFVATVDLNPRVRGAGLQRLRDHGVTVVEGLCRAQAEAVLSPFFHWVTTGRPEVWLKAAVSLDGRLATASGESAGMSGRAAHAWLHRLRDRMDAILVGVGTVLADNPRLTPRRPPLGLKGPAHLLRVVLDSSLRLPADAALLQDAATHPLRIFTTPQADPARRALLEQRGAVVTEVLGDGPQVDVARVLELLGAEGVTSVLVEGGAAVHGSVLAQRLASRVAVVTTPRIVGARGVPLTLWPGDQHLGKAPRISPLWTRRLGDDVLMEGTLRYG